MEKEILLSICIPTYNRDKFLLEAIDSIVVQLTEDLIDKVEICISDNASTDETETLINEYIQNNNSVRILYSKNKKNIGAEKNFFRVISMANGKYSVLMGSDDKYKWGFVRQIINYLCEDYEYIFINLETFFSDSNRISNNESLKIETNKIFYNKNEMLKELGTETNFISSSIFIRKNFLEFYKKNEKFISTIHETGWSYYFRILASIGENKKCLYLKEKFVLHRDGSYDIWYDYEKYFLKGMGIILNLLQHEGFSKSILSIVKNNHLKRYINNIVFFSFIENLKNYYDSFYYWKLFLKYILLVPKRIYKKFTKIYKEGV